MSIDKNIRKLIKDIQRNTPQNLKDGSTPQDFVGPNTAKHLNAGFKDKKTKTNKYGNKGHHYFHGFTIHDIFNNSNREYIAKRKERKILFRSILIYFAFMTACVISFLLLWHCSYKLKIAVVSGFFVNLVGLLVVVFKYAFSPSNFYYSSAIEMYKLKRRYQDKSRINQ